MDAWNALLKTPCTGSIKIKNKIMPISCMKQASRVIYSIFNQQINACKEWMKINKQKK